MPTKAYRSRWAAQIPIGMGEVYRWICQNYVEETSLGGWVFYRYLPDRP